MTNNQSPVYVTIPDNLIYQKPLTLPAVKELQEQTQLQSKPSFGTLYNTTESQNASQSSLAALSAPSHNIPKKSNLLCNEDRNTGKVYENANANANNNDTGDESEDEDDAFFIPMVVSNSNYSL
ncbi:hypothetical protein DAMA08_048270 [Martiniozyma asiatica (nom. inval.)]|nr:hypothetical protein DAMA08_048270 [Martiniozyma asiatica]